MLVTWSDNFWWSAIFANGKDCSSKMTVEYQTTDGDMQAKELQVFNSLWNESGAPIPILACEYAIHRLSSKKTIELHVLRIPLLFDDFNDAVRHFLIQKNHSHIKNRFSGFLPTESKGPKWWNSSCSSRLGDLASGEGAAKFHVRVWLKKRHFRWMCGSGKSIWIVSSCGIYTTKVRQKRQKAGRNSEKWYHSPNNHQFLKQTIEMCSQPGQKKL